MILTISSSSGFHATSANARTLEDLSDMLMIDLAMILDIVLDSSKIRNELNWNQKISFDDGIKKTVDWYLNNSNLYTDVQNKISKPTSWK